MQCTASTENLDVHSFFLSSLFNTFVLVCSEMWEMLECLQVMALSLFFSVLFIPSMEMEINFSSLSVKGGKNQRLTHPEIIIPSSTELIPLYVPINLNL